MTFKSSANSPYDTPFLTRIRTSGRIKGLNAERSVDLKFSVIPNPLPVEAAQIANAAAMNAYC
jgi:hypothetical protein